MDIVVDIADFQVTSDPTCTLITYSLGSCVGVAIWDPQAHVGGLLHYMLPDSSIAPEKARLTPAMFADPPRPDESGSRRPWKSLVCSSVTSTGWSAGFAVACTGTTMAISAAARTATAQRLFLPIDMLPPRCILPVTGSGHRRIGVERGSPCLSRSTSVHTSPGSADLAERRAMGPVFDSLAPA